MESEENADFYNLIISFGERENENINTDDLNKEVNNSIKSSGSNAGGTNFIFSASPIFDSSFVSNKIDDRAQINMILNEMIESIEYLFSLNSTMHLQSTNTSSSNQSKINDKLSHTLPLPIPMQRLDITSHPIENNPSILSSFSVISPRSDHPYNSSVTTLTQPATISNHSNYNSNYNDRTIQYTKSSYPNTNYSINNNNNNNNSLNINIDSDDAYMTNMIEKRNNRRNRRKEKNIELKQYLAVVSSYTIHVYCYA